MGFRDMGKNALASASCAVDFTFNINKGLGMAEIDVLERLTNELNWLRKLVYYQASQVRALEAFVASHIADLVNHDRKQVAEDLRKLTRQKYDEQISKIEKDDPAYAAMIDMRQDLKDKEQLRWYLPNDPE